MDPLYQDNQGERRVLDYMDVKGVAGELGCSTTYVRKLVRNQVEGVPILPAIKVGRKYLVSIFGLVYWARKCEGWTDEDARREAENITRSRKSATEQIPAENTDGRE